MVDKIKISRETKAFNKSYNEYVVDDRWKKHRSPEYFEYRRKWVENPQNMILEEYPIHLDVEITNYCNLLCTMCPRTIQIKKGIFPKLQHIDLELFKKVVGEGAANGVCSLKLNYAGEPLMHPNVVEMVKFAKDVGIIDVIFNTNAVLLTGEMSRGLLEAGIDGLFISFDSADKEKYESVRVGAKFDNVVANVKKFHEIRNSDERFWKTQIRVSKVLFPEEEEKDIIEFIEMWEQMVDAVGFSSLMEDKEEEIPYNPGYRCDQLWQRLFIRENGFAFPCCRDNKLNYVVGDANCQTVKEIWNGEAYKKLRDAHVRGKYTEIDMCKNCSYLCASSLSFKS